MNPMLSGVLFGLAAVWTLFSAAIVYAALRTNPYDDN